MNREGAEKELMDERAKSKYWPRDEAGDDYREEFLAGKVTYWFDVAVDERLARRTLESDLKAAQEEAERLRGLVNNAHNRLLDLTNSHAQLRERVAELTGEREASMQHTYCTYCGWECLIDDEAGTKVSEHILACEKHPIAQYKRRVKDLEDDARSAVKFLEEKDAELSRLRDAVKEREGMPKIVCLCGSTRFWREFQRASLRETLAGRIVLSIGAASGTDEEHFGNLSREEYEKVKIELDELHKRKIDLADEILVLNVGGYIGDSTRSEIEYAKAHGKLVKYLESLPQQPGKEEKSPTP